MNKKLWGFVAVAAFLSIELLGASQADAQGRLFSRMRGRFTRTQCCQTTCPTTCPTDNCGTEVVAAAPVSYVQPVSCCQPVATTSDCGGCQAVASSSLEPISVDCGGMSVSPVNGCQGCGGIQQATYVESGCGQVMTSDYYSSVAIGCQGCGSVQGTVVEGAVVQGCPGGGCGGVIEGEIVGQSIDGGVVEGTIIEGSVIEGSEVTSPSDVPEPPAQAPDATDADQDA